MAICSIASGRCYNQAGQGVPLYGNAHGRYAKLMFARPAWRCRIRAEDHRYGLILKDRPASLRSGMDVSPKAAAHRELRACQDALMVTPPFDLVIRNGTVITRGHHEVA